LFTFLIPDDCGTAHAQVAVEGADLPLSNVTVTLLKEFSKTPKRNEPPGCGIGIEANNLD
jgi:hypothetical protein